MKKHSDFIKLINNIFKESNFKVNLQTTKQTETGPGTISIKYIGESSTDVTLAKTEFGGMLKVFCYDDTQTKTYALIDEVLEFLDDKYFNDVLFKELAIIGSPSRVSENELFESAILFSVTSCSN